MTLFDYDDWNFSGSSKSLCSRDELQAHAIIFFAKLYTDTSVFFVLPWLHYAAFAQLHPLFGAIHGFYTKWETRFRFALVRSKLKP